MRAENGGFVLHCGEGSGILCAAPHFAGAQSKGQRVADANGQVNGGTPAAPKAQGEPVVIKKYANRRLYNTATSSYVTLDHLSEMVREGTISSVLRTPRPATTSPARC